VVFGLAAMLLTLKRINDADFRRLLIFLMLVSGAVLLTRTVI